MFTQKLIFAVSIICVACANDTPAPSAPTAPRQIKQSYYCSLNGITYQSESDYRNFCVQPTIPQNNIPQNNIPQTTTPIVYSSDSFIYLSSNSTQTSPEESTQNVSCEGLNFKCPSHQAFSAKQACESLEQNLAANGLTLSGPGKKQAIQIMVQNNCKCSPNSEFNAYMSSIGCLE